MRSAVTISLVKEAKGGPFVFWDDLPAACQKSAALGLDAVEIFAPGPEALHAPAIKPILERHGLKLAAVGTGAGWLLHRFSLTSADAQTRKKATAYVRQMIDAGGAMGAPAIVGSMQGRWGDDVPRDAALQHLRDALDDLGEHARQFGVPLIYEPLNRYETNLVNTLADGKALLAGLKSRNVKLLADLFHMSIEEADLPSAIRHAAGDVGHVHLADSNRCPATLGHTPFAKIAEALAEISFGGYISAECFPHPDPDSAAETTIRAFRQYFAPATPLGPH